MRDDLLVGRHISGPVSNAWFAVHAYMYAWEINDLLNDAPKKLVIGSHALVIYSAKQFILLAVTD